jgi:hypothetical protein
MQKQRDQLSQFLSVTPGYEIKPETDYLHADFTYFYSVPEPKYYGCVAPIPSIVLSKSQFINTLQHFCLTLFIQCLCYKPFIHNAKENTFLHTKILKLLFYY